MVTSYTAHFNGRIAFHLYLNREKKDNILFSTIPPRLLIKCYQSQLYHIKKALVFNDFGAHRQLESLANKILENKGLHPYFYPEYLNGNFEVAEALIFLQNNFELKANTCYSKSFNRIEFFHLQQVFMMDTSFCLKRGKQISYRAFIEEYNRRGDVQLVFNEFEPNSLFFFEFDDENFDYVIAVCMQTKRLELAITLD